MNVKRLALALVLALTLAAPVTALAWGDAPTHFSLAADLVKHYSLPKAVADNPQAFMQAAAAPDLAWTPLFRTLGLTYVHSTKFAQSLLAVARNDGERAMAYAWGAHLTADATGERSEANPDGYIPEAEPLHQLVEVAVDTVVFYDHEHFPPPPGFASWAQVNVSIDTGLLFLASVHYNRYVKRVPLLWPWVSAQALKGLTASITAEYDYIKLKRDASLSLAFLNDLAGKGLVPSADFSEAYKDSVQAAFDWITGH